MQIRCAKIEDAPSIAKIHLSVWRSTYVGIMEQAFLDQMCLQKNTACWQEILKKEGKDSWTLLVQLDGDDVESQLVGFANVGCNRIKDHSHKGELRAINLLHKVQKNGYGAKVFDACKQKLKEQGYSDMMLWVLADNSAVEFYTKMNGTHLDERTIQIGGKKLLEYSFGWQI